MSDVSKSWKIKASARQRFVLVQALLMVKSAPKVKGKDAMRKRNRFRRALGLDQILAAILAAESKGVRGLPLVNEDKLHDTVPYAFFVTEETAEEMKVLLEATALSEGELGTLEQVIEGLLADPDQRASVCDDTVPEFDHGSTDDWTTPSDWRERLKAKASTPTPAEVQCPRCGECFDPTEE